MTRFRQLTIKFDTYKKPPNHNIIHLVETMSTMIRKLKSTNHTQVLICYLFDNQQELKFNLTYNGSIQTFANITCHVELEDKRYGTAKFLGHAFVIEFSSEKASSFKRKENWIKGRKGKEKRLDKDLKRINRFATRRKSGSKRKKTRAS